MAGKEFWKGVGMAVGLAAFAAAAVYVTKKTLEYMEDRQALDDTCCDCDNYINIPEEDFSCNGECDECADSDICECATCEDQDCDHCWADSAEGVWDDTKTETSEEASEDDTPAN